MTEAPAEPSLVLTVTLSSGGVHTHRLPLPFIARTFGDLETGLRRVFEVLEEVCDGQSHLWLIEPFAIYAAKDVARIQLDGLSADQMHAAVDKASATMGFRASTRVTKRAR